MKKFTVDFDVTLEFSEEVEAESLEDAENIIAELVSDGEFIQAPKATNQRVQIV